MASSIPIISTNWAILIFVITLIVIILFTDLSFQSAIGIIVVTGIGYALYRMITDSTSMLIVGLTGIIVVLLFAMASGYGRTPQMIVVNQKCDTKQNAMDLMLVAKKTTSCPLSTVSPPGFCPKGYYNFTDGNGNTLCCGTANIDIFSHSCPALGPVGVCSMAPGLEDTRSSGDQKSFYPLCNSISSKS